MRNESPVFLVVFTFSILVRYVSISLIDKTSVALAVALEPVIALMYNESASAMVVELVVLLRNVFAVSAYVKNIGKKERSK